MKLAQWTTATALGLLALESGAVPVKFPECARQVRVSEVDGHAGYALNEDCTVLYVLPPLRSKLSIEGYRPSPNVDQQCERLRKIDVDSNELEDVIRSTTRRMKKLAQEIEEAEQNLREGLLPAGETTDSLEEKLDGKRAKMSAMRADVEKWIAGNDARKLTAARPEGGRGKFTMETAMAELLRAFKEANPKLRVMAMPIDQAYLSINETVATESDAAAMPAVRSIKAVGLASMPLLLDPRLIAQNKELAPLAAPEGSKIFGGALSGEILLSNIGACAISQKAGGVSSFTAADVKDYIVASSTYAYQVQVKRKHKLTYNFRELVKVIHEQTKKGGLFSSKTINSLIDDRRQSTWINFEVSSEDGRYEYSDAYVREVKKEFIDRALAQVVTLKTGSPAALLSLIEPGQNGAGVIGDELGKCPHMYCQIGAAGFKVLNSIFGSSTAVSELLKTVSAEMTDVQTEKKMVPVYGTGSFN